MNPSTLVALLAAALIALIACRGGASEAPSCAVVGARFLALAKDSLTTPPIDPAMRRAVTDQLPAMRDSLTLACTEGHWTATVRTCLVSASSHAEFEACELQLTEAQRGSLDRAARGESGTAR